MSSDGRPGGGRPFEEGNAVVSIPTEGIFAAALRGFLADQHLDGLDQEAGGLAGGGAEPGTPGYYEDSFTGMSESDRQGRVLYRQGQVHTSRGWRYIIEINEDSRMVRYLDVAQHYAMVTREDVAPDALEAASKELRSLMVDVRPALIAIASVSVPPTPAKPGDCLRVAGRALGGPAELISEVAGWLTVGSSAAEVDDMIDVAIRWCMVMIDPSSDKHEVHDLIRAGQREPDASAITGSRRFGWRHSL